MYALTVKVSALYASKFSSYRPTKQQQQPDKAAATDISICTAFTGAQKITITTNPIMYEVIICTIVFAVNRAIHSQVHHFSSL